MRDDEKHGPWRCFHCDMLIESAQHAREHFGSSAGNGTFCAERAKLIAERDAVRADRDELDRTARQLLDEARRQIRNLEVRLMVAHAITPGEIPPSEPLLFHDRAKQNTERLIRSQPIKRQGPETKGMAPGERVHVCGLTGTGFSCPACEAILEREA